MNELNNNLIADVYFYNSYLKCKNISKNQTYFYLVRSILLLIFLPIDYIVINGTSDFFTLFLVITVSFNLLSFLLQLSFYSCSICNLKKILKIATDMNHAKI